MRSATFDLTSIRTRLLTRFLLVGQFVFLGLFMLFAGFEVYPAAVAVGVGVLSFALARAAIKTRPLAQIGYGLLPLLNGLVILAVLFLPLETFVWLYWFFLVVMPFLFFELARSQVIWRFLGLAFISFIVTNAMTNTLNWHWPLDPTLNNLLGYFFGLTALSLLAVLVAGLMQALQVMSQNFVQQQGKIEQKYTQVVDREQLLSGVRDWLAKPIEQMRSALYALPEAVTDDGVLPCQTVQKEAVWLGLHLDNLRALELLQQNRLRLSLQPMSVLSCLARLEAQVKPILAERSINLVIEAPLCGGYRILANPHYFEQTLLNLLIYAGYHSQKHTIRLQVFCQPVAYDTTHLFIEVHYLTQQSVAQTQTLLQASSEVMLSELFTDSSIQEQEERFGLVFARLLLERMEGELTLHCQPSSQEVSLMANLQVKSTQLEAQLATDNLENAGALQGLRFLLIESNAFNQGLLCQYLEAAGAQVYSVKENESMLDTVAGYAEPAEPSVDCVLIDLFTSSLDHFAAIHSLRQSYNALELPILALSASQDTSVKQLALDAGINAIVQKPITLNVLLRQLQLHLSQQTQFHLKLSLQLEAEPEVKDADLSVSSDAFDAVRLQQAMIKLPVERMPQVLELFLTQLAQSEQAVIAALAKQDLDAVYLEAERLKGSALYLYAEPLQQACEDLKACAKLQDVEACQQTLESWQGTIEMTREAVSHVLKKGVLIKSSQT